MSDETLAAVIRDVMADARHNNYTTTLTIERDTLKALIQDAVERGIEIGKAQALKPKKLMTKPTKKSKPVAEHAMSPETARRKARVEPIRRANVDCGDADFPLAG